MNAAPIATGQHGAGSAEERRKFIGGSDVAAVMGLSKWTTPLELWEKKTGRLQPTGNIDPARERILNRGKRWEQPALEMLVDELESRGHTVEIVGRSNRYIDAALDFLACEIDAEIRLDGELANVEIKTVHPFAAGEWGEMDTDEVPIYYATQAMHGLGILGRRLCVVGCLIGADVLIPYFVTRDDETIEAMRVKCRDFWHKHVLADVPPDPVNYDDMLRLFARSNGRPAHVDEETAQALQDLDALRARVRTYEADEESLKFKVADGIRKAWGLTPESEPPDDNAVIFFNGLEIGSWKRQSRESIDTKALKALHPQIAEEVTRTTETRILRAKRIK